MAKEISLQHQLDELKRELADRIKTYPSLSLGPKKAFSREEGAKRMARLEAVIATIQDLITRNERQKAQALPTPLFSAPDPKR